MKRNKKPENRAGKKRKKKTVSQAQVEANRENAKKSTGCNTDTGRAVMWLNPVSHGLTGIFRILPSEDPDEYEEYQDMYLFELDATGAVEMDLVIRIAQETWRMKRADAYEVDMTLQCTTADKLFKHLNLLALYRGRIQRLIDRTWERLLKIQAQRREGLRPVIPDHLLWQAITEKTREVGPGFTPGLPLTVEDAVAMREKQADLAMACQRTQPPETAAEATARYKREHVLQETARIASLEEAGDWEAAARVRTDLEHWEAQYALQNGSKSAPSRPKTSSETPGQASANPAPQAALPDEMASLFQNGVDGADAPEKSGPPA